VTASALLQIAVLAVALVALAYPLGQYMARVYTGTSTVADRVLGPVERAFYRLAGVDPAAEQSWKQYAASALLFGLVCTLFLYALQRTQAALPLNPDGLGSVGPHGAFSVATSFATNTNWQWYGGETTMSYLTQMLGLTVQNFVSAAAGMAVLAAVYPSGRVHP
jgi:K+-transporting ATPase ATPase A chain